jgi:Glycine zipper
MSQRAIIWSLAVLWLIGFVPITSFANDLFIYPNKNQSAEKQDKDKWECRVWATKQSGFDPAARPKASTPPPAQEAPKGGLVRGAAGGAALGAVGGAIAGSAGKGAAIGAATGGLLGVMRRNDQVRQQQHAQQQWATQNVAQYEQQRGGWERALKACLTGRGYTVQ